MTTDTVDQFLHWAEHDRLRSPNTLLRYRTVLNQLEALGIDPAAATLEDIDRWWNTRLNRSPATRENELACLRAYYKWATRFDHRTDDPTRRLDAPKINHDVPRPIGETDLNRLLGPLTANTPDLRRAAALMAYAGMRGAEAANATWDWVDQDARRIYIRGKGRKERVIGLSPVLLDKLLPETGGNIVTAGGTPYSPATLERKINRLMNRHGIDHRGHDLRKRAATLAISKTGDVYAVAQALGWASVETASAYAVVGDEALDKIANAMI